jgi:soluble cytochrome b562
LEIKRSKDEITPESYLKDLEKKCKLFKERAEQLAPINKEAAGRYESMIKILINELDETKKFIEEGGGKK